MRFIVLVLFFSCVGMAACAQPPAGDGTKIEILPAGKFYHADLHTATGDTWWVLFATPGEGPWLRYAPLSIQLPDNGRRGDVLGEIRADGFAVSETILLFRGTKEIPRGPVASAFHGVLTLVPHLALGLGTGGTRLEVVPAGPPEDAQGFPRYTAYLDAGGKRQQLCEWGWKYLPPAECDEIHDATPPALRWAGDLDKDDRLDLLLNMPAGALSSVQALFLSGHATGNELVHQVATCEITTGD